MDPENRYLHLFETEESHDAYYGGDDYLEPCVALTEETSEVSFNKPARRIDDILNDLAFYPKGKTIVIDMESTLGGTSIYNRHILLSDDGFGSLSSMVSDGITYDMGVEFINSLTDFPAVPVDSKVMLITNYAHSFDDESIFRFDDEFETGETYTVYKKKALSYSIWVYDLANRVKHTVNIVSGNAATPLFPTYTVSYTPVVQREITKKKIRVIDADALRHITQLSDRYYTKGSVDNVGLLMMDVGEDDAAVRVTSTEISDYLTYTVENYGKENIQTLSIVTKPLFRHLSFSLANVLDIQDGTWTYRVVVDGVEVASTEFSFNSSAEEMLDNRVEYSSHDDVYGIILEAAPTAGSDDPGEMI